MTKEEKRKKGIIKVFNFDKECKCKLSIPTVKVVDKKEYSICTTCNCVSKDSVELSKVFDFIPKEISDPLMGSMSREELLSKVKESHKKPLLKSLEYFIPELVGIHYGFILKFSRNSKDVFNTLKEELRNVERDVERYLTKPEIFKINIHGQVDCNWEVVDLSFVIPIISFFIFIFWYIISI